MGDLLKDITHNAMTRRSTIGKILACLDTNDRQDLKKALDNKTIPAAAIRAALAKRDIVISISAIYRYRNEEIDCELE
jgi:hypothetical protein